MPEIKLKWEGENLEAEPGPDEDLGSRYLIGRQLAHEYHDPATREYISAAEAAHQAKVEAQQTEMQAFKAENAKKADEAKQKASDFAAQMVKGLEARRKQSENPLVSSRDGATAPTEPVAAHVQTADTPPTMQPPTAMGWKPGASLVTPQTPEQQAQATTQGIEAPIIDPTMAFGAGAGARFAISLAEGKALMPSLGRAIAAGMVNVGQDVAIGAPAEALGGVDPALVLPAQVIMAVGSARATQAIEDAVIDGAARLGKVLKPEQITEQAQAIIGMLQSGGKELAPEVVTALNRVAADTPVADILRILKNEKGELTIRPGTEPTVATPPANVKGAGPGIPPPPEGDTAAFGPNRPPMVKAAQEFNRNTNPDITTSYAGEASGGNLRIWSEDLMPKFVSDIQSEEDIMRVLSSGQEVFAAQKDIAARGVRTWGETEDAARQYGIADLLGRKSGQAFNAEQIEAGRQMLVTTAGSLKQMSDVVRSGAATDLQKMEFMRLFNIHYAVQMQLSGIAAEAGRALNIFRKVASSNDLRMGQLQNFMEGVTRSGIKPEQLAERLSMMENPGQVAAFVRQGQRATTIDMWNEAWINGLLWMPPTHLANITSNTVVAMLAVPERLTGAAISKIPGIGSGELHAREALAQAYGGIEGFKDGVKAFAKAMRTGKSTDLTTKLDVARPAAITAENVQQLPAIKKLAPEAFSEGSKLAAAVDYLGEGIRLPGRGLAAEDDFFKAIGYRMELRARAWRKAVEEEGLTGKAAGNRIAEILSDPQKYAPEVHLAAIDTARYQTFTSALRSKIAGAVAGSRNPVVKAIAPFVSTPYNVMLYSLERTPMAALSSRWREEFAAGGARRDLALGQMTFGSMAIGAAVGLAMQGSITGNGPSDPTLRQAWLRAGNKPLTFTMGNWQVDFSRLEPIATVFGYGADFAMLSGLTEDDLQPEMEKLAGAITMSLAKNSTNKTFVEGFSNAIEAMDDPDRYMQSFLNNYAGSLVPSPLKYVERAMSPEKEAVTELSDAIWGKIPWISENMPKKRDLWGNAITLAMDKDETTAQMLFRINSPIQVTRRKEKSPIDEEFLALKEAPGMPRKIQHFEGVPYKLDNAEYEEFILRMNAIPLSDGLTLKPSLYQLVQSADYKDVKRRSETHAYQMIQAKLHEAQERAKYQMLEMNPEIRTVVDRYHQLQQAAQ